MPQSLTGIIVDTGSLAVLTLRVDLAAGGGYQVSVPLNELPLRLVHHCLEAADRLQSDGVIGLLPQGPLVVLQCLPILPLGLVEAAQIDVGKGASLVAPGARVAFSSQGMASSSCPF